MNVTSLTANVIVKAKEADKPRFKKLIYEMMERNPGKIPEKPKCGIIGNEIIFKIKVEKDFCSVIVEKLLMNNFLILTDKNEMNNLINKVKLKIKECSETMTEEEFIRSREKKRKQILDNLSEYALCGNYFSILKYCIDTATDQEINSKAKELLPGSVIIAIEDIYHQGKEIKFAESSFNSLFKIACDRNLLMLSQLELIKRAGLAAIELCVMHKSLFAFLIDIIKTKTMHNEVSVQAVIVFWNEIKESLFSYNDIIQAASKKINLNALADKFLLVSENFSIGEKKLFNEFFELIKEKQSIPF
ncbi:MAG: hypothetical protein GXX85_00410 [Ignavibacteria bacterium]|nr:hypothetical protein [Ignavibacteria bacterium]